MDSAVILFLRSATLQISCQLHNQLQHTGASTAQQPHNFQHNQESSQDVVTSGGGECYCHVTSRGVTGSRHWASGDVLRDRIRDTAHPALESGPGSHSPGQEGH